MLPTAVCTVVRVVLCSALLPPTLFGHLPLLRPPLPLRLSTTPSSSCPAAQIRGPSCREVLFIPCLLSPSSWVSRCFLAEGCQTSVHFLPQHCLTGCRRQLTRWPGCCSSAGTRVFPVEPEPEPEWDRAPPCKVCLWTRIGKRKGLFGLASAFFIYFVSKTFFFSCFLCIFLIIWNVLCGILWISTVEMLGNSLVGGLFRDYIHSLLFLFPFDCERFCDDMIFSLG